MNKKIRLDKFLTDKAYVNSRSQAEGYIKLKKVTVNGRVTIKPGRLVSENDDVKITTDKQYVSRGGLKLASVASGLGLGSDTFAGLTVLDVGSSTGGFTDYALYHGASKVIAVDVGTKQLHASLHGDPRIELHEQTDIRNMKKLNTDVGMVLIDVSFISISLVLSYLPKLIHPGTIVVGMVKPQFESRVTSSKHKGIIKNDSIRRQIFKDFEQKVKTEYKILGKADSAIPGEKGNRERFYKLQLL